MVGWFNQFPLGESAGQLFATVIGGKPFGLSRMPMGWTWAPFVAQSTLLMLVNKVLDSLPFKDIHIFVWIDNVFIIGKQHLVIQAFGSLCKFFELFKMQFHEISAGKKVDFVGLIFDLEKREFSLKKTSKLELALDKLDQWTHGVSVTNVQFLAYMGSLVWACYASQSSFLLVRNWLSTLSRLDKLVFYSKEKFLDLSIQPLALKQELHTLAKIIEKPWPLTVPNLLPQCLPPFVFSDACMSGLGAVILFFSSSIFDSVPKVFSTPVSMSNRHGIMILELKAVFFALKKLTLFRNSFSDSVILFVDNQSLYWDLIKMYSPSLVVQPFLVALYRFVRGNRFKIFPIWVPSKLNWADGPSRVYEPEIVRC
jgi:hypothetical protein